MLYLLSASDQLCHVSVYQRGRSLHSIALSLSTPIYKHSRDNENRINLVYYSCPSLLSLRQQTKITTEELAQQAGVSLRDAYIVEIGGFADREIAEKVLNAFLRLSGTSYTLDAIRLRNVSTPVARRSQLADLPTTKQAAISRRKK